MTRHSFSNLNPILSDIESIDKPGILDIGSSPANSFALFSAYHCKMYFESFEEVITNNAPSNNKNRELSIRKFFSRYDANTKFDVILSWDLLNYLELDDIFCLIDALSPYCKPNTLFHMVQYIGKKIPEKPKQFTIINKDYYSVESLPTTKRKVAAHSIFHLMKKMAPFTIQKELKNNNFISGYCEHLFRYSPPTKKQTGFCAKNISIPALAKNKQSGIFYQSPALKTLCSQLRSIDSPVVLDLGSEMSHNVSYFSTFCDRIHVDDMFSSLKWQQSINKQSASSVGKFFIQLDQHIKFDAILLWDIINYCTKQQIHCIGQHIAKRCHAHTQIYSMIYSSTKIPSTAQHFCIQSDDTIMVYGADHKMQHHNKHSTATLLRLLDGYKPENFYTQKEGMYPGANEYLFSFANVGLVK
ncbi:MAG: hypothetical protein JKY66_06600 [Spongiibacteraceae bacterium]|nr:hypothetical protein [Spongiibacteraceae bacterium]